MKIVILGSGNVATHLAKALKAADEEVVQIWSLHLENAKVLADEVGAEAISEIKQLDGAADLCLIAVRDDAIPSVLEELKDFKGIVAHTSGAVALETLNPYFDRCGVLYPLQTFSKSKNLDFSKVPLCIEANTPEVWLILKELAEKLSQKVIEVNSEKRKILHLAAVFACNFTNHLYALAGGILAQHAIPFDILRPLIVETASKVQNAEPKAVQTGPAVRNDEQTINKHLELLLDQPHLLEIYKILSESIKKTR